jgi:hypothetical protein
MDTSVLISCKEPGVREHLLGGSERSELLVDESPDMIVRVTSHRKFRAGEFAEVVGLLIQWGGSVGAGIITNWLYDKLKDKKVSILINGRRTEINRKAIAESLRQKDQEPPPPS